MVLAEQVGKSQASAGANARQKEQLLRFWGSEEGRRWQAAREALPITAIREPLLAALEAADVAVVSGETGSGKTCAYPPERPSSTSTWHTIEPLCASSVGTVSLSAPRPSEQ